jgi:hypothetical protein
MRDYGLEFASDHPFAAQFGAPTLYRVNPDVPQPSQTNCGLGPV